MRNTIYDRARKQSRIGHERPMLFFELSRFFFEPLAGTPLYDLTARQIAEMIDGPMLRLFDAGQRDKEKS